MMNDASQISVNLFLAGGAVISVLGIVILLTVYIYKGFERRTEIKITALETKLNGVEKTVDLNDKNMRDSSHEFRTTVATTYVTRQELAQNLRDLKDDMRNGFNDLKTFFIEPRKP